MSLSRKVIPAFLLVLLFSVMIFVPAAYAADFRSGDRVVIAADQVIDDDLYVTAEEIIIDGTIKGDVYAVGRNITINGTVDYDVNAAGQTVVINGKVGSDARLAGQAVILGENSQVARSLLAAAFSLETQQNSSIGNDLLFVAYQALLGGSVGKDVVAGGNGIELTGSVGRNMRVSVGDMTDSSFAPRMFMGDIPVSIPTVPFGLTLSPSAVIAGELVYESQNPAAGVNEAQVTGPVVQQTPVPNVQPRREPVTPAAIQAQQTQGLVDWGLDQGRRFLILLLLGLLALWLLPKFIGALAQAIRTKPLGSLGRGVLMVIGFIVALFAIVIAAILLAVLFGVLTLGELSGLSISSGIVLFGVLTFAFSVFTSYIAPIVVSFLIGRAIFDRVQAGWAQNRFVAFIVGLILLSLISLVPILNILVGLLVAIVALGALAIWFGARGTSPSAPAIQPA